MQPFAGGHDGIWDPMFDENLLVVAVINMPIPDGIPYESLHHGVVMIVIDMFKDFIGKYPDMVHSLASL